MVRLASATTARRGPSTGRGSAPAGVEGTPKKWPYPKSGGAEGFPDEFMNTIKKRVTPKNVHDGASARAPRPPNPKLNDDRRPDRVSPSLDFVPRRTEDISLTPPHPLRHLSVPEPMPGVWYGSLPDMGVERHYRKMTPEAVEALNTILDIESQPGGAELRVGKRSRPRRRKRRA